MKIVTFEVRIFFSFRQGKNLKQGKKWEWEIEVKRNK